MNSSPRFRLVRFGIVPHLFTLLVLSMFLFAFKTHGDETDTPQVDLTDLPDLSDPLGKERAEQARIAKLVRQLGDRNFQIRRTATSQLWECGRPAVAPLQAAKRSPNREVVKRAQWLLDRLEYGILPTTAASLVPLIHQYRDEPANRSRIIREMAKFGEAAVPTLRNLEKVETDRELLKQLAHLARSFTVNRMWAALRNGELADAEVQLRIIGGDPEMHRSFASFFAVLGRLDEVVAELTEQFHQTKDASTGVQLIHCLRAADRPYDALRIAMLLGERQLIDGLLFEGGRWTELANRKSPLPNRNEILDTQFSRPMVEYHGFRAACLRLAGNTSDADRVLNDLVAAVRSKRTIGGYRTFVQDAARVLLINDRPNAAIDLIIDHAETMPYNAHLAFDLLCVQDRHLEAFEFAEEFVEKQFRGYERLQRESWLQLNRLGEHDLARQLLSDSFDEGLVARRKQQSIYAATGLMAVEAIELGMQNNLRLVDDMKIQARDRKEWDVLFARVLSMPDDSQQTSAQWISNGMKSRRSILLTMLMAAYEDAPQTVLARARFLLGMPTIEDSAIGPLTNPTLLKMVQRLATIARGYENYDIGKAMEGLGFVCFRVGEFEQGREYLREGIKLGGQASRLPVADSYAHQKNWSRAYAEYDQIKAIRFAGFAAGWCQFQLSRCTPDEATRDKLRADGSRRMKVATLQFLDRTSSRRSGITRLVEERGWSEAEAMLTGLTRQTEAFGSVHLVNAYGKHGNELRDQNQLQLALDSWERNRLSTLDVSKLVPDCRQLLTEPFMLNRERARWLISRNRIDDAVQAIQVTSTALPGRADIAIEFVPILRSHGKHEFAQRLLKRIYEVNHQVCEQFNSSLKHRRRLARLSVQFDWRIQDGLKHAQAALKLAPGDEELIEAVGLLRKASMDLP